MTRSDYVAYVIARNESGVLEVNRLHSEPTLPYRTTSARFSEDRMGAYDLVAVYLLTCMGIGAITRRLSDGLWIAANFPDDRSPELVVLMTEVDKSRRNPVEMWGQHVAITDPFDTATFNV